MEWFIYARSFAAPFFSDDSTHYVEAGTPEAALERLAVEYKHPAGLYAAEVYASADDYHKRKPALAQWLSNHERAKQELTGNVGGYSFYGHAPGDFEINGERHIIPDPKDGRVVPVMIKP